jgi:hypothetical protein
VKYKVVPFIADIEIGQGTADAAEQLSVLVNGQASEGWTFMRLENIEIIETDPGSGGCFGFGAKPFSQKTRRYDMAVFSRD